MNRRRALILVLFIVAGGCMAVGQTVGLNGPTEMGRCEDASFTIAFTADPIQTASKILFTATLPNAGFAYVTSSGRITLHDGTPVPAAPTPAGLNLIWDLDSLLPAPYVLPPGETVTLEFALGTGCGTASGTLSARVDYEQEGIPGHGTDSQPVEILPGAVRIYKEPSVQEAHVGDTVAWTITVENTGLGPIHNVVVTDTLGWGLSYVSSNPPGAPSGQQVTWSLGSILAGGQEQVQLSAEVVACEGLDNRADARFGCDDGSICFDTAVDGGTATASIHLLVDNPYTEFLPPPILIPYCTPAGTTMTMTVTNTGAGPAKDIRLEVNFPADLSITAHPPASWDGTSFQLPDLGPGESFDLMFDVVYTGNWCAGGPAGNLYWQAIYKNVCGNEFRPPALFSSYGTDWGPAGPPSLSVTLSGDGEVYICTEHAYNLSVSFSGLDSCGGGTTSTIDVTADVPSGFTVTDPGGGSWIPGGDGTGGTITWTGVDPAAGLNISFTLRAPGTAQCGQVATLTATATATDCCGCELSASATQDIAIECYQLVTATREATPTTQEKCGTIAYTNTYVFADDPALDGISFNELVFTEEAANFQDYVEGSLSITIDGTPANAISVVDNTPGGTFEIQGINDTGSVRGHTLVISYQLAFTASSAPTGCPSSSSFYDWVTLDLGPDCATGDQCTAPCQDTQVLVLTAATPSMAVSLSGLPGDFVDPCGTYDVTLTLTKTSDFDPHNVKLQLANLNYYIVDLSSITCSGVCPPSLTPTDYGTYYEWDYGDAFVGQPNGAQSVLQFQVRKRCNPGRDLVATALFEDSCGYSYCGVMARVAPSVLREPLLYIYKAPEVIYATENEVTWTIYVTNGGAGPAYEVWAEDELSPGLEYVSSTASDPAVTAYPGQDHLGNPMNGVYWHVPEIPAGGTVTIDITARLIACQGLTDEARAGISCGGDECHPIVSDTSSVLIPDTVLVATSHLPSPMAACQETEADITIRNAGDPTAYHLVARMALPPGVEYVPGSTQWQVDGPPWNSGGDPTITGDVGTGYTLEWDENQVSGLTSLASRSTIVVKFGLRPVCNFDGGYFEAYVDYETVCQEPGTEEVGLFYVDASRPELSVTKRQVDPPAGSPVDCSGQITWEITVTNIGDATADYVWVEDTLGDGLSYVSSAGDGVYAVDNGFASGQTVTWALEDLPPGGSATLTLTAQDTGTCGGLSNTVRAQWGCGDDLDSSSATNDAKCLDIAVAEDVVQATRTPTASLQPSLDVPAIEPCGAAVVTLTIDNTSTATARAVDVVASLPAGLSYVPGTTEIDCGSGYVPAADPNVVGSTLVWYDTADTGNNLCDSIPPGGTAWLRFQVQADCFLTAGDLDFTIYFYDCCLESQEQASTLLPVSPALPQLAVTITPEKVPLNCYDPGNTVTWTITVTNQGQGTAEWVYLEDALGDALVYVGSNPPATLMPSGVYAWEFGPLAPGESATFQITAYLSHPASCAVALRESVVRATWGCGTPDGNPATIDGCESGIWVQDSSIVTVPDLTLSPSDITPSITCNADGAYSGDVAIRVRNTGDAPVTKDFLIRIEDGTGWSTEGYFVADFGGTLPVNPGSSRTIHIDWPASCNNCSYQFTVTVDVNDEVCECDEADNTKSRNYTLPIPDLVVQGTNLSLACAGDGKILVSGTITVGNPGCGDFTGNIPVTLTLYDGTGGTGNVVETWNENFSASIPAGGSQAFNISRTIAADTCATCAASLVVELDPGDVICECDGTNNSYTTDLGVSILDLVVDSTDISLSCAGDGEILVSGTITVGNPGCGDFTGNIPVTLTLYDGTGGTGNVVETWNENFSASIPAGGSQAFNISRPIAANMCATCAASLVVELDPGDVICECDGTNNSYTTDLGVEIPDLAVTAVTPQVPNSCQPGSVEVTVENVGCSPSPAGVVVRVTGDATGEATLPALNAGGVATVTVPLNEVLPCGFHEITATADPDDAVCECSSANNARSASFQVTDPDLTVTGFAAACNGDDTYTATGTVANQGSEASPQATLRIYIDGTLIHSITVPALAIGESYGFTWTSPPLKCGEGHLFRVMVDEENAICECDEGNNQAETTASCPCPALVTEKEVAEITRGGLPIDPSLPVEPGDVITYRLSVTNAGGGKAFNVDISDTLPVEFLYRSGTTSATWPSGTYSADPTGVPGPSLFWDTSAELGPSDSLVLEFQAVVTSAVVQGKVYTDKMCATGEEGDGTPIPPDMSATVPADDDPDDCSSVSHVAAAIPALSVDKEIVDVIRNGASIWPTDTVEPGDLIHWRFTIRNVGEGTAYDVDFTDELPPGLVYDTSYADGTYTVDDPPQAGSLGIPDGATGHLVADLSAEIAGGGTLVADFFAYVTSAVQQGVPLDNHATASGEDGYDTPIPLENPQVGDTSDDDPDDPDPDDTGFATIGVAEPALALEKEIIDVLRGGVSIWPTSVVLWGDVIVYRVTVRNVGLGTAYDVNLTDELPVGLSYDTTFGEGTYTVSDPASSGTLGIPDGATGTITADISATLAGGGTLVAVYRVRVTPDAVPGTYLLNLAMVTGRDGAGTSIPEYNPDIPDGYLDQDSTSIRVGAPALVTDKSQYCPPCDPCEPEPVVCDPCAEEPIPVRVGELVRFQLTVTNVGYSTAYDIVVEDHLPKGFVYVAESATLSWPGGRTQLEPILGEDSVLTWITGLALDAGESLTLVFAAWVTEDATVGEEVVNVMRAEGVDAFNVPIPADSSMFVIEDEDPEDSSSLRLLILPPPPASSGGGR